MSVLNLKRVIVITLLLSLTACGQVRAPINIDSGGAESSETRQFNSPEEALAAMEMARISCTSDQNCPEAALAMYSLSPWGARVSACSASLIGEKTVLTNAHCLPTDLWRNGVSCRGRVRFAFAQTPDHPRLNLGCDRVVSMSWSGRVGVRPVNLKSNDIDVDWAIVELEEAPGRTPIRVNQEAGIPMGSEVEILAVHMRQGSDSHFDQLRPISCRANVNSYFTKHFLGPLSPIFNVSECGEKVRGGHSGSAVVNADGELVGVFSFMHKVSLPHIQRDGKNPSWLKEADDIQRFLDSSFAGGTQVACIPLEPHQPLDPMCEFDIMEHNQELAPEFQVTVEVEDHEQYPELRAQAQEQFSRSEAKNLPIEWILTDNIDLESLQFVAGDGREFRQQRRWNYTQRLRVFYPFLPKCVRSQEGLSSEFAVPMPRIEPEEELQVDRRNFRRRRAARMADSQIIFRQKGDAYEVEIHRGLRIKVPSCSN